MASSNPKIEVGNQSRARCCGRVAQYELHIASEKKHELGFPLSNHYNWNDRQKRVFEDCSVLLAIGNVAKELMLTWRIFGRSTALELWFDLGSAIRMT